jgi:hypothetical protein
MLRAMSRSYISAKLGELRGILAAEPILQLTCDIEAGALPDGASALFLVTGFVQADAGSNLQLGSAPPVLKLLGFSEDEGGGKPYTTQVAAQWTLSDTAVERIEKIRNGGNLTIWPTIEYVLISPGGLADWPQSQKPIRVPWPGNPTCLRVEAHEWSQDVLEQWQLASAVSLVVALPATGATDDHRTVVARLTTAKRLLKSGKPEDLKASVAASREACELLRKMRPEAVHSAARQRDLAEREAIILARMSDLAQALFDYDSAASHPDPHLRDIVWRRENAVLALGTATSLAQLIFART